MQFYSRLNPNALALKVSLPSCILSQIIVSYRPCIVPGPTGLSYERARDLVTLWIIHWTIHYSHDIIYKYFICVCEIGGFEGKIHESCYIHRFIHCAGRCHAPAFPCFHCFFHWSVREKCSHVVANQGNAASGIAAHQPFSTKSAVFKIR